MQSPRRNGHQRRLLERINPLLKIGVCLGLIPLALVLNSNWALGLLVITLGGCAITQARLPLWIWGQGILTLAVFGFGAWALMQDGAAALHSLLRVVAMVLPAPLLAGTTPPMTLVRALQTVKLPGFLVLSLMLIWRFLPLIYQEAQRILEANQLRGIDLRRQPRYWFTGLLVPLIFQIVDYADNVTIGLQTRGYDPTMPRTLSTPLRWQWLDLYFAGVAVLLLGSIGYLEWGLA